LLEADRGHDNGSVLEFGRSMLTLFGIALRSDHTLRFKSLDYLSDSESAYVCTLRSLLDLPQGAPPLRLTSQPPSPIHRALFRQPYWKSSHREADLSALKARA